MSTAAPASSPAPSPRAWRILTWCAIAAFAAFRLSELTRYSLWYDELFSLTLAQRDWADLLRGALADRTNPPLFYALLKLWISVGGESVAWMRLLPCLLGILVAVPLVALMQRWIADMRTAVVTVTVASASPLAVFLSNEIRGYSLLLLLTAASHLAYARVVGAQRRRFDIVAFALVNLALVYTHYFGWLVVAAEVGAAALWHRRALLSLSVGAAAVGVAFAPWLVAVRAAAVGVAAPLANVDWIGAPAPADIPRFFDALVARVLTPGTAWIGAVLVIAPLVVLGLRSIRPPRGDGATPSHLASAARATLSLQLAWLAAFPVVTAFAASLMLHRSVFVPRYLIVAAPAWWLLVGVAVAGLIDVQRHRALATGALAAFATFTLAAGAAREWRGGEKIQWGRVVAAIAADAGPSGGLVYSLEGFTALPAAYYAATLETRLTVRPARNLSGVATPAWLVVRSQSGPGNAPLTSTLGVTARHLTPIVADTVPSHIITAYRIDVP